MPHTVLNRILRHNIRNELTVALGHLDAIEDEQAGRAAGSVRRVNELAEKARTVEHALRSSGTVAVSADTVARDVVADASAAFPDAAVEAEAEPATAAVAGEQLFEQAVAELVENGIEHGDETPRVRSASGVPATPFG